MSNSAIKQLIKEKLLKDVERAERNTIGKAARKALSTKEASQCLVLNTRAVTALVLGMEAGIGRKLSSYERKKYRKEVKEHFIKISKPYPQRAPGRKYFLEILAKNNLKLGESIFFLGTDFKGIKTQYHKFNKNFLERTKSLQNRKYDENKPKTAVQFDHGAEGTAVGTLGGGSSVVSVALDKGVTFGQLEKVANDNLEAVLALQFKELSKSERSKIQNRLFDIIINSKHVVEDGRFGGINAGVGVIITPVKTKVNQSRASLEKKEQDAIIEAVSKTIRETDWYNQEGSSSVREKAEAAAVKKVVNEFENLVKKTKGSSVKTDPSVKRTKLKTQSKGKERTKAGKGVKISGQTTKRGRLAAPITASKGGSKAEKSNFNTLALIGVINQRLSETVAKNMGSPRLNFQTGRFAGSVRVTDISMTAKGHPSIGYTYQRNPYEVFEASSGTRFSSVARDPRRLIDTSIREIAAQQAVGRLFTRRL